VSVAEKKFEVPTAGNFWGKSSEIAAKAVKLENIVQGAHK
jgi:hypothetical protein